MMDSLPYERGHVYLLSGSLYSLTQLLPKQGEAVVSVPYGAYYVISTLFPILL